MIPGKHYTAFDLLDAVWRRRWLVLVSFAVCTAATVVVAGKLPNRFRAAALIATVPQGVSQDYVRATVTTRTQLSDRLPTIRQQILSRTRLEPLILEFNLYAEMRQTTPMEAIVEAMRRDTPIDIVGVSESLRIGYEAPTPEVAFQVATRLAAVAIEENVRDREQLARETSAFLEKELEDVSARLAERDKRLEEYRLKYGPELPTQLQSNMQASQSTQMQMQSVSESLNRDRDRRNILARQLADLDSEEHLMEANPSSGSPAATAPASSLAAQLETERADLRSLEARLTREHPDVASKKRQIVDLEGRVRSEVQPTVPASDPASRPMTAAQSARRNKRKELQTDIDALDAQIAKRNVDLADLQKALDTYRDRVEAVPTRESELAALTRDYDTLQLQYRTKLAKREDAKTAEKLELQQVGDQFKIVDPPRQPERPVRPNRPVIDAAGGAGGLLLGVVLALLLEFWDKSVKTEAEMRAVLSLPVLAFVPLLVTEADRRRTRWRRAALGVGVATVLVLCATAVWLNFRV